MNPNYIPEINNITKVIRPKINALMTRLKTINARKGVARKGASLNGKALVKTYAAVLSGFENEDRFRTSFIKPEVSVSVHVSLDCSGSMDAVLKHRNNKPKRLTTCNAVAAAAAAMVKTIPKDVLKESTISFVDFENIGPVVGYRPIEYPLFDRGEMVVPPEEWGGFSCVGATSIEMYAWSAVRRAARAPTTYKVAIYMTDGDCNTVAKLCSINEQAKRMGVTLVGVVMGNDVDPQGVPMTHPNGVFCTDGGEFAAIICKHLEEVLT